MRTLPNLKGIALLCLCQLYFLPHTLGQSQCISDKNYEKLISKDEIFFQRIQALDKLKISNSDRSSLGCTSDNSVVVPVAVHYFDPIDCSQKQCLLDAAQAQIDVMNEAFSASNLDLSYYTTTLNSLCSTSFPLSRAPMANNGTCVQFCLATQDHPISSGLIDGEPAITLNQETWPSAGIEWSGYLNIFVSSPASAGQSSSTLGISALPGSANGDGFWVNYAVFGGPGFSCFSGGEINSHANFNEGKTSVHEAGHYFGLHHVFRGSGCDDGDSNPPGPVAVMDTPEQDDPHYGCPSISSCANVPASCTGGLDNFYSYMDYSNDGCMVLFTADQSDVINFWGNYLTWKDDAVTCATALSEVNCSGPSCDDGIQNGNETGIDCGGNMCNMCNYQCGDSFVDSGGTSLYFPSENNTWTICTAPSQVISLSFTEFQIEDGGPTGCYDKLELFDGNDETAPSMGVFCGNNLSSAPGEGYIESSASCLTIKFTSDASVQETGWVALVGCSDSATCDDGVQNGTEEGIDCGGICGPCPETCGASFFDVGGPTGNYNNGSFETFLFCPTEENEKIKATFTWSDIECTSGNGSNETGCWDMLKIYDGPDQNSLMLGNYCGEESGDGDTPGVSENNLFVGMHVTSTHSSGCLYFTFESDNSINETGWEASIECVSSIVPLEFLSIEAKRIKNHNLLYWSTANEVNNYGFVIERSLNGIDFDSIGFQLAVETGDVNEYTFEDRDSSLEGVVYYRLQQRDFSGERSFSKIISLEVIQRKKHKIYPNPILDLIHIDLESHNNNTFFDVHVYDKLGREMFNSQVQGKSERLIIDTNPWPSGTYVVVVKNAGTAQIRKLVKNHTN